MFPNPNPRPDGTRPQAVAGLGLCHRGAAGTGKSPMAIRLEILLAGASEGLQQDDAAFAEDRPSTTAPWTRTAAAPGAATSTPAAAD